jgi:hypothetical protein
MITREQNNLSSYKKHRLLEIYSNTTITYKGEIYAASSNDQPWENRIS